MHPPQIIHYIWFQPARWMYAVELSTSLHCGRGTDSGPPFSDVSMSWLFDKTSGYTKACSPFTPSFSLFADFNSEHRGRFILIVLGLVFPPLIVACSVGASTLPCQWFSIAAAALTVRLYAFWSALCHDLWKKVFMWKLKWIIATIFSWHKVFGFVPICMHFFCHVVCGFQSI